MKARVEFVFEATIATQAPPLYRESAYQEELCAVTCDH
jgi:hypothetical protein